MPTEKFCVSCDNHLDPLKEHRCKVVENFQIIVNHLRLKPIALSKAVMNANYDCPTFEEIK